MSPENPTNQSPEGAKTARDIYGSGPEVDRYEKRGGEEHLEEALLLVEETMPDMSIWSEGLEAMEIFFYEWRQEIEETDDDPAIVKAASYIVSGMSFAASEEAEVPHLSKTEKALVIKIKDHFFGPY